MPGCQLYELSGASGSSYDLLEAPSMDARVRAAANFSRELQCLPRGPIYIYTHTYMYVYMFIALKLYKTSYTEVKSALCLEALSFHDNDLAQSDPIR